MIHGFEKISEQTIQELRSVAILYKHQKTGAQLLSIVNNDENKVFGITFRTPPKDSTGVAHILEHSVLCGSRKFPVKEPFVELLKSSLQTFLNAMTYPDKTCYPVASQNTRDFYNLIDVYLDAVFYPRITKEIFDQEGWHYEIEDVNSPLSYKGVVFNEMKGAYSSPDNILAELSQQSLFPHSTYGLDSGGNPRTIPDLTYRDFTEFHKKYYHPSNSRIYFYGDDDPDERLRFVNNYLKDFDAAKVASSVRAPHPFDHPIHIERFFPASTGNSKAMVTLNWLLCETNDTEMNFALQVLTYILLGMPGSPLRKALIDSGFGEDLAGSGLETELKNIFFSIGLKSIQAENALKVENLILNTLRKIADKGIDRDMIEAALNTIEFKLRENNTGSFPVGLFIMLRALTTWLHDADPLSLILFESPLDRVKAKASNPEYFSEIIKRFFLNNNHRSTVVLIPDDTLSEKDQADEKERLDNARKSMSVDDIHLLLDSNRSLKKFQETPDSPEDLSSIPTLYLSDIDKQNKNIPIQDIKADRAKIYFHDIYSNNIFYIDIGFNAHVVPQNLISYLPLVGRAFLEMGTEKEDFVIFSQRISRKTGGISKSLFSSLINDSADSCLYLFFRCKTMGHRLDDLLDILKDMLLTVKLDNRERFKQIVLEAKSRMEQRLIPEGNRIANLRLRSHFNEADWASEQMGGISYLFFLRQLAEKIDNDWPKVLADLQKIKNLIVNRSGLIINITTDKRDWKSGESKILNLADAFAEDEYPAEKWTIDVEKDNEGLVIPSQVNYVAKGTNIYDLGYAFHGSVYVILRFLKTVYLWERIRVRGGAYGAMAGFDRMSGVFSMVSYRDPNLLKTLDNFDYVSLFLQDAKISREELKRNIIGAIGDIDSYMLPDTKGYTSLLRTLNSNTDELRQKIRDEIFATKPSHFKNFGEALYGMEQKGLIKLLGNFKALETASKIRKDIKLVNVM